MSKDRKTAVMYGAGNIGRGFIGQVLHDSGYEVVFIDIDRDVVSALNKQGSYIQLIVDDENTEHREITGVRAVDGQINEEVAREIASCEIMAVSVGAAVLPRIAPIIADGIKLRVLPLNILVCENLIHAPDVLRDYVSGYLTDTSILSRVGFVGATIGRMVPVLPPEQRASDLTFIAVERFCELFLDGDALIQPMPKLQHVTLCSPFSFEEGKKLYIHNMGHALAAYFGYLKGYTFIWQAIEDKDIYNQVHTAMSVTAEALARKYKEDRTKLSLYVEDLLKRFANKGLGDTIARVGGDPMRKLSSGDRLIGSVDLCAKEQTDYTPILSGIAAALHFKQKNDPSSNLMHEQLIKNGTSDFLLKHCRLSKPDAERCVAMFEENSYSTDTNSSSRGDTSTKRSR